MPRTKTAIPVPDLTMLENHYQRNYGKMRSGIKLIKKYAGQTVNCDVLEKWLTPQYGSTNALWRDHLGKGISVLEITNYAVSSEVPRQGGYVSFLKAGETHTELRARHLTFLKNKFGEDVKLLDIKNHLAERLTNRNKISNSAGQEVLRDTTLDKELQAEIEEQALLVKGLRKDYVDSYHAWKAGMDRLKELKTQLAAKQHKQQRKLYKETLKALDNPIFNL